jgi:hypothetical protein
MRIGSGRVTLSWIWRTGEFGQRVTNVTDDPGYNLWAVCGCLVLALVILAMGGAAMNESSVVGSIYIAIGVLIGFVALRQLTDFIKSFFGWKPVSARKTPRGGTARREKVWMCSRASQRARPSRED